MKIILWGALWIFHWIYMEVSVGYHQYAQLLIQKLKVNSVSHVVMTPSVHVIEWEIVRIHVVSLTFLSNVLNFLSLFESENIFLFIIWHVKGNNFYGLMKCYFSNYIFLSFAGAISTKGPQRNTRDVSPSSHQSSTAAWQSTPATPVATMQWDAMQEDISLLRSLHVASPVSTCSLSFVHSHDCPLSIGQKDRLFIVYYIVGLVISKREKRERVWYVVAKERGMLL